MIMGKTSDKQVEYLVVDTTAFIQNASLQKVADNIVTCPEVVAEITNKRQLRRLVVLPYDLIIKEVFPEYVKIITDFSKKTGDYPSLSATDIKVMALTYQLQKEKAGVDNLRLEPVLQKALVTTENKAPDMNPDVTGFYIPAETKKIKNSDIDEDKKKDEVNIEISTELANKLGTLVCADHSNEDSNADDVLVTLEDSISSNSEVETDIDEDKKKDEVNIEISTELANKLGTLVCADHSNEDSNADDVLVTLQDSISSNSEVETEDEDDSGWITPSNINTAKKQVNSELLEETHVTVACMTTDFAMQNVLKQINLNIASLDGRLIKQLRTYILRCYTCFKTTSIMTKKFCPKCGNDTLKKVAVSLDENGKMQIHINPKRPLTTRGKKYSLPRIKGGKHPNNPILVEDQPMPDNRPSRLTKTKNNPLDDDYIAGFSPFVMRDVNSKSAQLGIRPGQEFKYWMRKNPNEARKKRK